MLAPDLILHGGKIITLDRSSRVAQAIAVRSGHITAVGEDAAMLADAAPTTRLIALNGRAVLPGFFDAHPHADREGLKARGGIPIAGLHSVAAIVAVVKRAAQSTPAGGWIVLMPMGEPPHEYISRPDQLSDGRFPTRHDLDAVAPDHAVYIRAVWGWWSRRPFPSVANSLALERAGVTRDTPAPHNVEIVKDARGEPTGVFLEHNFVPVLEYTLFRELPRFNYADRVEGVRLGAHTYAAAGTTSLYEGHGLTPTVIRAYRENAERNALPLRMHAPVSMPSAAFDDKRLMDLFHHYAGPAGGRGRGDDILRVEGINLGGHADATVADIIAAGYPYDQWAGHFYQAMTRERFVKLGTEAARLGLRVNCVVSRDLEYALSAYEAIDKEVPIRDRRWVVIHVNQASDEQIRRMKALGVIATVVPGFLWMAGDRYGLDQARWRGHSDPAHARRRRAGRTVERRRALLDVVDGMGGDCALGRGWPAPARREPSVPGRGIADRGAKRTPPDLERGSLRIAGSGQGCRHGGARRGSAHLRSRSAQGYRGRADLSRRAPGLRPVLMSKKSGVMPA